MGGNSTFCGGGQSWANACVGNNGSPSYMEYSKGFSTAANMLLDQVIDDRGIHLYVDELIYPICFNMRHSVELRLKGAIDEVFEIAAIKGVSFVFDSATSHDIGIIWDAFKSESESLDSRYVSLNAKINQIILDIASVDSTGQTFRYPVSNESQKHLVEVSIINIVVLKEKFAELEQNLDLLHRLNLWLRDEYQQGTHTSKLSRPMIYHLAMHLPPKNKWGDESFSETKSKIRAELNLSSNDLSKAIAKITGHYYLASLVGITIPLEGVADDQLISFFDEWIKLHPDASGQDNNDVAELGSQAMLEEIINSFAVEREVWDSLSARLTPKFLAGMKALFYFARDKTFVEYYSVIYARYLKELQFYCDKDDQGFKESFRHLIQKTNALENVLITLFALGNASLAELLIERYSFARNYYWIEKARSGELFGYPEFAGY